VKHQLSNVTEHQKRFSVNRRKLSYPITRTKFETLIQPKINDTLTICERLIGERSIDQIILVGGSCRIPCIAEHLTARFRVPVTSCPDLDMAVCSGAAVDREQGAKKTLEDVQPPLPEPIDTEDSKGKLFSFDIVVVKDRGGISIEGQGQAHCLTVDLGKGVGLEMVYIPGGSFVMGSPASERSLFEVNINRAKPQHRVTVQPFHIGKYPITQKQYITIMDTNPAGNKGGNRPVERVGWSDAVEFCKRLSQKIGRVYRLPSEAEWEYACRAGTTTPFYFGEKINSNLVNYCPVIECLVKPLTRTTDVGKYPPNAFGLSDMHGNVWEWCQDTWHKNYDGAPTDGSAWISSSDKNRHVLRGGSYDSISDDCRSAVRSYILSAHPATFVGFRVVLDIKS
jgi:formylglycine-generating enzyme required for sulfatase activity